MTETLPLVRRTGGAVPDARSCCTTPVAEPLSGAQAEGLARILKAIADPVRLRLLSLIQAHDGAEACVCDLTAAFGLSQPTISHHLKVLTDAGLVSRRKVGTWAYYRVLPERLAALASALAPPAG